MIVVRYAKTDENMAVERARLLGDHKAYLRDATIRILLSGPFGEHRGAEGPGALVVAEVADFNEFIAFSDADPFVRSKVYKSIRLVEWSPTFGDLISGLAEKGD